MAAEGVKNEPRPSDAPSVPSTERVTITGSIPGEWLDRLLVAHCQVRADAPLEESVEKLLDVAFELCDDAAFGVVTPRSALPGPSTMGAGPPNLRSSEPGQIVVRVPATRRSSPVEPDPTRLFPDLGFEQIIPFLLEHGATLHAAADDPAYFSDGTAPAHLLEHLARMLASLVDNKRAQDRSMRDLRAQVIQSEKLASLGQIAAGIVHELNNPLTTIVAYSDFLQRKLSGHGDPADVERLGRINEAAERILRFSRDLTAYSRPASELPAPVAIHDVIERALVFCEHELEKTGVIIERDFGEVRAVQGVPGQLTQVFVNLFTNAAHAMREDGGLLTIATSMTESEVAVTIRDDGHGVDAGHRERIFEPFFTTKTDGSGTGLGLSIVRSILQSHGGRISVDGNEPRGTVFQVELPTATAHFHDGATAPNPRPKPRAPSEPHGDPDLG